MTNGMTERNLAPEQEWPCPEAGCDGTIKRRYSNKYRRFFYGCTRWMHGCRAGVGCHPDGRPLGTPATHETRRARMRAHAAFDPLWKTKRMSRARAYAWLAEAMERREVHMGEMDVWECELVIRLVRQHYPDLERTDATT